jgi:phenylalanyl-tRNA synthetase beta chain
MAAHLQSIGFDAQADGDAALKVNVPSFRVDVSRPQDLMEEVARLSGYNQIPTTFPALPSEGVTPSQAMVLRNRIRDILSGFGFSEAINYSFIGTDACDQLQLDADDSRRRHVALLNPISEDLAVMRTSLVPGMLEAVQRNLSRQQTELRMFEIGKAFFPQPHEVLPQEKEMLVGCWTGAADKAAWHTRERACDFYDIKGTVEGLALALGIHGLSFMALADDRCDIFRAGHTAQVRSGDQVVGHVGALNPAVVDAFRLKPPVFVFELDVEQLAALVPDTRQMESIPRFPSTTRDVTVIVDQEMEAGRLMETVAGFEEALVEDLFLFDVFTGEPIPAGKKSVSFRVVYRSAERTLDDETVNSIHQHLTHRLITDVGAALPA